MPAFKVWLLVGLGLSLIGGLLVSVEAIKLENLRGLVRLLRDRVEVAFESPMFAVGEDGTPTDYLAYDPVNVRRGFGQRTRLYVLAHLVAGAVPAVAAVAAVDGLLGTELAAALARQVYRLPLLAAIAVSILAIPVAVSVVYMAGEFVIHTIIITSVRGLGAALEVIERNTPSGSVGLVGVAFLLTGFVAQVVGTAIS